MLNTILSTVLKPTLNQAMTSINASILRYFTPFNAVAQSYVQLTNSIPVSVSEGFEIEVFFEYISNEGSGSRLLGFSGTSTSLIKAFSNDAGTDPYKLNFALGGQFLSIPNFFNSTHVNKLNKLVVKVVEDDILFYLNDEFKNIEFSKSTLVGEFDQVATGGGQDFSNGPIYDIKIWTGGDRDTGNLILDMPLDQRYTTTNDTVIDHSPMGNNGTFINISDNSSELFTLENGDWLGEELVTQENWESPYTASSGWTYNEVDNTWSLSGDGTAQGLFPIASFAQPLPVRVVANVLQVDGDGLLFSSSASTGAVTEVGVTTKIVTPDIGTFAQFKRASGIVNAKISKPSVKAYRQVAY